MTLDTPTILPDHIQHAQSGRRKTICVTAVLTALGVPASGFHYTGTLADNRRVQILNRHGFSCRSRLSAIGGRGTTIGKARKKIASLGDAPGTMYMVAVKTSKTAHLMLLDSNGQTVVDTAPRKADKRRIVTVHAVQKSS